MNLGRAALKLLLSRTASGLLFFGGITIFARLLPAEEMGVFFLFLALLGVLSIPADLGIRGALEKRLSEGRETDRLLGAALAVKVVSLTGIVALILVGRPYIDAYANAEVALLLAVGIVVQEFARFYVQAVRGELRVGKTAPPEVLRRLTWVGVGGVLVLTGMGVKGLILAQICGRFVEFLWAFLLCDVTAGDPSVAHFRSLFSFSVYQTLIAVGGRVYQWMDVLVVGFFLSNAHVSAYELAWQVTLLTLLASKSIELTLFPQLSNWEANAALGKISETVSTAFAYAVLISVPAIVGSVLYAGDVLRLVFGPEYTMASLVLVVLMVEKLFQSVNGIVNAAVRALDRPGFAAKTTAVAVGVNLVLSPLLLVTVGLVGVAIATALSWLVNASLQARYLSGLLTIEVPARIFGWYVVSALAMGAVLVAVRRVLPVTDLLTLLVHVGLGVAVYGVGLVFVPTIRNRIIRPGLRALSM